VRFDLAKIIQEYYMNIEGVIHVGAHHGQEYSVYRGVGIQSMIFFEPLLEAFDVLRKIDDPDVQVVNKAVGNFNGRTVMYIDKDNQGMSSSVLRPKKHLVEHPQIKFEATTRTVEIVRLDDYLAGVTANMLVIDVQGYELEVLRGAEGLLKRIDYIVSEVNDEELYEECVLVEELEEYLGERGFDRREISWTVHHWGDALFIRR
jgi:FkbM family methyltransferase